MKRYASYVLAVVLMAGILPLATAGPAGALPGTPSLTAPSDGLTVSTNPVLAWSSVAGATSYRVQVSASTSFTPLLVNAVTANTKYGHTADLPLGVLYWRVAAIDGSGQGDFSVDRTFTKEPPSGPDLLTPADGADLEFPSDPLVLSWEPFAGTDHYEVQIDSEPTFTAPITTSANTTNPSYTPSATPSIGQPFYWRIRSISGGSVPSQYSDVRSYTFAWSDVPLPQYPPDDNNPSAAIEEVVFEWSASSGAVSYDLQVSPTDQFTSLTVNATNIHGTRYSPAITVDNGAYFWRVRARNHGGAVGAWSPLSTFYRGWPAPDAAPNHRITLQSPADGDQHVRIPEFRWSAVRLASSYQLQVGTDVNFSPGTFSSCTTQHTSFIPIEPCDPDPGQTYYWRVRAIDAPQNVNGLFSSTFSFQYDPGIPQPLSPADGATGLVSPVELTWAPVSGGGLNPTSRYQVTILDESGEEAETAETMTTTYVPQDLRPQDGPFTWYVQIITDSGDGNIPGSGGHFSFSFADPTELSAAPDPVTPNGVEGWTVPPLEWEPVSGATTYEIWRATVPSEVYTQFKDGLREPGYAHTGASNAGSYTYFIRANLTGGGFVDGDIGSFTVNALPASTLQAPNHCPPNTACPVLPTTPTLQWAWNPEATHYLIYLASDPNFTNVISGFSGVEVHYPRYRPLVHLPDAQAGQATYWYARPCKGTSCGPEPGTYAGSNPPIRAFTKRSNPVVLTTPANQAPGTTPLAQHANQITFGWQDYLASNLAAAGAASTDVEARGYVVEISTTADMQSIIHASTALDQTTYTVHNVTLPDGPLYWRVRAIDGSSNPLSFSEVRLVHKRSPLVSLTTPTPSAVVSGVPLFGWESQDFAARYTLEVYRNVDLPLATGNRVVNVVTPLTDYIPASALAAGTYGWRVRRLDADGRPGPWSADTNEELRRFVVAGDAVSLLTPAHNGNFPNNNQSFTWTTAAKAAQYRFQADDNADFSSPFEQASTVMTSWHSTKVYPNGTYHWRVQTIDGDGNITATSAVRTFTHGPPPPPASYYHPLTPERILDSRPSSNVGAFSTKWGPGTTREVLIAGNSDVPADADAVALNVTVTGTTAASWLTIWPKGQSQPTSSNLNWSPGQTIANATTLKVGTDERVMVNNAAGSTDVIFDVVGYYDDDDTTGGGLTPLTPSRLLDTRTGSKLVAGGVRDLVVAGGSTGVPADADAVVLNVTATGPTANSFLTVWPEGESQPNASSVNFKAGQTIPNAVTAAVGDDQEIQLVNAVGSVDVIVDVVGYFDQGEGAPYRPLPNPVRFQDSRPAFKVGPFGSKWAAGTQRDVTVVGAPSNIPTTAVGALLNVTVTGTTGTSFLTIHPTGTTRPNASSLNWTSGVTIANAVTTKLGTGGSNLGKIRVYNQAGSTDVIMDVYGYYG